MHRILANRKPSFLLVLSFLIFTQNGSKIYVKHLDYAVASENKPLSLVSPLNVITLNVILTVNVIPAVNAKNITLNVTTLPTVNVTKRV